MLSVIQNIMILVERNISNLEAIEAKQINKDIMGRGCALPEVAVIGLLTSSMQLIAVVAI